MSESKNRRRLADAKTSYFVCIGGAIGALLGLVAYVKDWL